MPRRRAPRIPLPIQPYMPAAGRPRPVLPIAQALRMDAAGEAGFSPTLFASGLDVFHAGCFWEAHECWETLWRREPKSAPRRRLLQGLIFLAAARVKARQGRPQGAAELQRRALAALTAASEPDARASGIDLPALVARAAAAGPEGPLILTDVGADRP